MQKENFLTKIEYFASPTPELCQWAKRDFQKLKHQIVKRLEKIFETLIFGKKLVM